MKLRLLMIDECNRQCKGCCNKDHDLAALPVCKSFVGYDQIMLTGGEPMLQPRLVLDTVERIRKETTTPIYLYTAYREDPFRLLNVLTKVDGMTLTLHTKKDVEPFYVLNRLIEKFNYKPKSLRLNVFHGIGLGDIDLSRWQVKKDMRWIKECPLPTDEVFMRLNAKELS